MKPSVQNISVIVCAYTDKRWDDLLAAISSLERQTLPPRETIVVIDHNPALFERARTYLDRVTVIENQFQRGLSGARNSGVAIARGSLIAFLDDDATAEPDWLARVGGWCDNPGILGAGGQSRPVWLASRPAWFPEEFDWVVGCSYRGLPKTASPVRNVLGGSMCLRREIFDVGGFSMDIGRVDAVPLGCEETELCIRARQRWPQGTFIYEPQAVIHHKVPAARTRWSYFCSRCYAEGLSKARLSQLVGAQDGLSSERTYTLQTLPRGVWRGLVDTFAHRDDAGLLRAGAIVIGLATTATGYAVGRISQRLRATKQASDKR